MTKGRIAAWLCFVAAVACVVAAGWNAYRIVEPAVRWNRSNAVTDGVRLRYRHDGAGLLVYYVYAKLSYEAAGQRVTTEASSDVATYQYFKAREVAERLANSSALPVYWNPSKPSDARFALAYAELAGSTVVWPAIAAVALAGLGVSLRKNWTPPSPCPGCKLAVKRYYRFCPHCRFTLPTPS